MTKNQILLASMLIVTGMFSCKQKEYTKLKIGFGIYDRERRKKAIKSQWKEVL